MIRNCAWREKEEKGAEAEVGFVQRAGLASRKLPSPAVNFLADDPSHCRALGEGHSVCIDGLITG
jgi:hypothetical protein